MEQQDFFSAPPSRKFPYVCGDDGRLFPVPVSHSLYHSFYEFAGGFPTEYNKQDVDDLSTRLVESGFQSSRWYYPGSSRADVFEDD